MKKMARIKHYPGEFLSIDFDDNIEVCYGHVENISDVDHFDEMLERQLMHEFQMYALKTEDIITWGNRLFDVTLKNKYGRIIPVENDDGGSTSFFFSSQGRGAMPITEFTFHKRKSAEFDFEIEPRCLVCNGHGIVSPKIPSENMFAYDKCEQCHGNGYIQQDSCKNCSLIFPVEDYRCICKKIPVKHDRSFKCNLFNEGCTIDELLNLEDVVSCHITQCKHHPGQRPINKNAGVQCSRCTENYKLRGLQNLENLCAIVKEIPSF